MRSNKYRCRMMAKNGQNKKERLRNKTRLRGRGKKIHRG